MRESRMRRVIALSAVVVLSLGLIWWVRWPIYGQTNLIANAGFETAGTSSADAASWTEGSSHARASDRFHSGGWALKSSFTGAGTSTRTAAISVTPNTSYTLSGWIYKGATVGGTCIDMNDIAGELQLCASQSNAWQFVSGSWNSGATTSVVIRLVTDANPNGNSWFDDLSLSAGGSAPSPTPTRTPTPAGPTPTPPSGRVIAVAAGDIACGAGSGSASCRQMATSDLLLQIDPHVILPLGDTQYEEGALSDFQGYFHPSWGRLKSRIRPSVGNHEYLTTNAAGYFDYFNGSGNQNGPAGDRSKGYYSYDLGAWHFIALNSNCSKVGGCAAGNPQHTWLQNDLAASSAQCTIAYMHHPVWTSDTRDFDTGTLQPLMQLLYNDGVELVLVGHSHFYERFRRQDANEGADPGYGVRQIIVGTGGRNVYGFGTIEPGSEVRNGATFGVLKLTLDPGQYSWQFVPIAGQSFSDSGSESCHGAHP